MGAQIQLSSMGQSMGYAGFSVGARIRRAPACSCSTCANVNENEPGTAISPNCCMGPSAASAGRTGQLLPRPTPHQAGIAPHQWQRLCGRALTAFLLHSRGQGGIVGPPGSARFDMHLTEGGPGPRSGPNFDAFDMYLTWGPGPRGGPSFDKGGPGPHAPAARTFDTYLTGKGGRAPKPLEAVPFLT